MVAIGAPSSGDFQEVDGETEERRRARLERHQRTQERAVSTVLSQSEVNLFLRNEESFTTPLSFIRKKVCLFGLLDRINMFFFYFQSPLLSKHGIYVF